MDSERTRALVATVQAWPATRRRAANLQVLQQPPLFDIEAVSACNIVCEFCPRDLMTRPETLMTEETFAAVCNLLPQGAVVMFSGLGDSILHPKLPDFVRMLVARDVSPCLITNGIRLTPERQGALIEAGIAQFQISVHGLSDRDLRTIVTRGANSARVRSNAEYLAAHRPSRLRVRINFVETPANADCRPEVEAWADKLGFEFYYRRRHNRGGSLVKLAGAPACHGCGVFAAVTFVSVEGQILPCVNDVAGRHPLGQVGSMTWPELLERKRGIIANDAWPGICSSCDDDYRWIILSQGQVDVPSAEAGPDTLGLERPAS